MRSLLFRTSIGGALACLACGGQSDKFTAPNANPGRSDTYDSSTHERGGATVTSGGATTIGNISSGDTSVTLAGRTNTGLPTDIRTDWGSAKAGGHGGATVAYGASPGTGGATRAFARGSSGLSGAATTSSVPWTNGIAPLHVDGKYLKDPDGNVVILRGVSIADPMEVETRGAGLSAEQVVDRISDASLGYSVRTGCGPLYGCSRETIKGRSPPRLGGPALYQCSAVDSQLALALSAGTGRPSASAN